jgi:catechol 2,3-dioxygenase
MTSSLQVRAIELRVSSLARSLEFYVRKVGFVLAQKSAGRADLACAPGGPVLLSLIEDAKAAHPPADSAGLFHMALLFPHRGALGRWLRLAAEKGIEFQGFSDHGVSEAIYFSDPDQNGIEFYADRPRDQWPFKDGELAMMTERLDVPALLNAALPATPNPLDGARWGHLHLRVTDLARSDRFYRDALGMQLMQGSYPGARFLAADGYHHHVGLNTWGSPRDPQPAGALGLARATFARAGVLEARDIRDPDNIAIRVEPM